MRIMGLDYGSVTVGVAISDALLVTAQGIEVIRRKQENKLRQTLARIDELVKEYEVNLIVLGYPKNMNNTVGERGEKSEEFAEMLRKRTGLEVILWDERLTTVSAHNAMIEGNMRREDRAKIVDKVAAVLILQGYLDRRAQQEKEKNKKWKNRESRRGIMSDNQEKITFTTEDGEQIDFYVLQQTTINGENYILVADNTEEDEEANALILKESAQKDSDEVLYDVVEDEEQLNAIAKVFEELMEDIDILV